MRQRYNTNAALGADTTAIGHDADADATILAMEAPGLIRMHAAFCCGMNIIKWLNYDFNEPPIYDAHASTARSLTLLFRWARLGQRRWRWQDILTFTAFRIPAKFSPIAL